MSRRSSMIMRGVFANKLRKYRELFSIS